MTKRFSFLTWLLAWPSLALAAAPHLEFTAPFAPSDSFVKPAESPWRQDICLNGSWQFQPVSLPDSFKDGRDPTPALPPAPPDRWEKIPIRIPSPWNANSFAGENGLGGDFRTYPSYPREWEKIEMGWLRKAFTVPAAWQGRHIQLHFGAVAGDAEILVNGKAVGRHFGIFFPFDVDITDAVQFGRENELLIGIRKPSLFDQSGSYGRRTYQAGSFWGQHIAGIWQDVDLVAVPAIRATDIYIKPLVDSDRLEAEVTLRNDTAQEATVTVQAAASAWISHAGNDLLTAPLPSSELSGRPSLEMPAVTAAIPAHGETKVIVSAPVQNRLKLWSPGSPNLYGLVTSIASGNQVIDSKYSRFGWRQVSLQGNQFLLNGEPFVIKGDSWHFLGIPQMTRRYAWAWFHALRDAHLNAVRLHAQPYPPLYLDMADEMGVLVLDETAIWASDGGPKLDDPAYWDDSGKHVAELVMRDRNHPSILGWSVSNEVMPIVVGVMRNPPGIKENLVRHYGIWADICRNLDPTRQWISADGEDDGEGMLPTYMVHYGGEEAMVRAAKNGKPWGVGEAGNAYYGTPEQVSQANGSRAYESFEGRMEGVAASSYDNLQLQRQYNAIYRSVFNLVWYGLKPLPLGLTDPSRPPTLDDGVYFTGFQEGRPGVQPERLGPYCTTLNPGYDPALPLYETWPLFDAIRDASAEPPAPCRWVEAKPAPDIVPAMPRSAPITSAAVLTGPGGDLADALERTGVPLAKLQTSGVPQLLFIDGANPPPAVSARPVIEQVLARKGTVIVWGASVATLNDLNALLPAALELTSRTASSLLPAQPSPVTEGLSPADLYYSELRPPDVTTQGLAGPLVRQSSVLLQACDTDWLKWNKQPEYAKTAMVLRSEREAKPSGVVLIATNMGEGTLLVTTLPAVPRLAKEEKAVRTILANLGLPLEAANDSGKPLLKTGEIARALMCASFPVASSQEAADHDFIDPARGDEIRAGASVDGKPWQLAESESGLFDFIGLQFPGPKENAVAYLSFWVSSPRALDDLLIEPNIPVVGMDVAADDGVEVWLNGQLVLRNIRTGPIEGGKAKVDALKLRQGWNHFLVKVIQVGGAWQFRGRLTCNQPDFLAELESALEKP